MAIRSISRVHITKIVSVRSIDLFGGLKGLLLNLCLEIGKACTVFKEGAAIGYGGRVIEVNKDKKISHFFNFSSLCVKLT
jgi:hypothetical protein